MTILTLLLICSSVARRWRPSFRTKKYEGTLTGDQKNKYKEESINEIVKSLRNISMEMTKGIEHHKAMGKINLEYEKDESKRTKLNEKLENVFSAILTEIQYPFTILEEISSNLLINTNKEDLVKIFLSMTRCISNMTKFAQNAIEFVMDSGKYNSYLDHLKLKSNLLPNENKTNRFTNDTKHHLQEIDPQKKIEETKDVCEYYKNYEIDENDSLLKDKRNQLQIIRIRFNSFVILNNSNLGLSGISDEGFLNKVVERNYNCLQNNSNLLSR